MEGTTGNLEEEAMLLERGLLVAPENSRLTEQCQEGLAEVSLGPLGEEGGQVAKQQGTLKRSGAGSRKGLSLQHQTYSQHVPFPMIL